MALVLGAPYLIVGVIWSSTHTAHLKSMSGPVLLFSDVCMT